MAYEKMRNEVKKAIPSFVKITPPQPAKVEIKATAKQREGALETLKELKAAFGPKGKYWVQDEYHTVEEGIDKMCLSGALNKIDGQHEALARVAISLAIAELFTDRLGATFDTDDNGEVLPDAAKEAVADQDDALITTFNDNAATEWEDVVKVFNQARKILRRK